MKGLPKTLNSKSDYLYIKENYDKEIWKPLFENLLNEQEDWLSITEEEYKEEEGYKKIHNEQDNVYYYFKWGKKPITKIERLGFTEEEINEIIKKE